jgi:4-amino-4-deoxy-L-arabinose transferase-like glycosyltransferase
VCLRRPQFAYHFLWEHNVVRFVQPFDHLEPVWYFVPILLGGLLPTTLLLVPFGRFLVCERASVAKRRSPELGLLLLAGGWCVFFFSLSGCKLPTYILPGFAPLALALGTFVSRTPWRRDRRTWAGAALAFVALAAANHGVIPIYARQISPLSKSDEVRALCGDPAVPVVCIPRGQNALAFDLGREDFHTYRGKDAQEMLQLLRQQSRSVVFCTHNYPIEQLRQLLTPDLALRRTVEAGDCTLAVVERR